jgi:hypothetical protein
MNNALKIGLALVGGYGIYKVFQLYKLSNEITYEPVGFDYVNGNIQVKMKLNNPADISLNMKGIDGKIFAKDTNATIGTFKSGPFTINKGVSFFTLDFKIDILRAGTQLITYLINKNVPMLSMKLTKRLQFGSTSEIFDLTNIK